MKWTIHATRLGEGFLKEDHQVDVSIVERAVESARLFIGGDRTSLVVGCIVIGIALPIVVPLVVGFFDESVIHGIASRKVGAWYAEMVTDSTVVWDV